MRLILKLLFIFLPFWSFSQGASDTAKYQRVPAYGYDWMRGKFDTSLLIPKGDTSTNIAGSGQDKGRLMYRTIDSSIYFNNGVKWTKLGSTVDLQDYVKLTQLSDSLSNYVRIQTQSPTATISTSPTIYQFTAASSQSITLSWSAGRAGATSTSAATAPLSSIVVGGVSQSFVQPSAPGSISSSQSVTATTNTNTTYSTVVTTTDGKTATASLTIQYQNKIYAGFVSTSSPTSSDIISATGSSYVGGKFSTTISQSGSLSSPGSSEYIVFASPVSFGTPTVIINGLTVTYNLSTISFTNSDGYTSNYYIAVSPFPTSGPVQSFTIQ